MRQPLEYSHPPLALVLIVFVGQSHATSKSAPSSEYGGPDCEARTETSGPGDGVGRHAVHEVDLLPCVELRHLCAASAVLRASQRLREHHPLKVTGAIQRKVEDVEVNLHAVVSRMALT